MSFLLPTTNTNSKASLAKDFKVRSRTQIKKVSDTYWSKQLPKKGIKMKTEESGIDYVKYPGVRAKMLSLLRKRGYITEKTLEKDLIKEKVKSVDRRKVVDAMRGKFAKKENDSLTPEQILDNVKRSRAVSRLMSTRGMSKAQEIEKGRRGGNAKERFKQETYARLDVHGESHAISALGGQTVNPDDARYKEQKAGGHVTSAINQGPVKSVAGENKDISSAKTKETAIAAGVGLKKTESKKGEAGSQEQKTGGSVSNNLVSLAQTQNEVSEKETGQLEAEEIFRPCASKSRPVFDSEWQGGVVLRRGRKAIHFPDTERNSDDSYKKAA